MKPLVVYYSRTGHTKRLAEMIAQVAGADIEGLIDRTDRSGIWGYLRSGRDAWSRKRTTIDAPTSDPGSYHLVFIGTPVWASAPSTAIRTYLEDQAVRLPTVAFFCTFGGNGSDRAFAQMRQLCGKAPVATLARTERQLGKPDEAAAVEAFVAMALAATGDAKTRA